MMLLLNLVLIFTLSTTYFVSNDAAFLLSSATIKQRQQQQHQQQQHRKTFIKVFGVEKKESSSTSLPETSVQSLQTNSNDRSASCTDNTITIDNDKNNYKNSMSTTTALTNIRSLFYPFNCSPPYIALVTETITCDNDIQLTKSIQTITTAIHTNLIHLIYIRIPKKSTNTNNFDNERKQDRIIQLIQHLTKIRTDYQLQYIIVISSDWIDCTENTDNDNSNVLLTTGIDGIHFKESHRHLIPIVQSKWIQVQEQSNLDSTTTTPPNTRHLIVGTSTHTIQSTIDAYTNYNYCIDYFIAGTCFFTSSHVEKQSIDDLEGPAFPHQVKVALSNYIQNITTSTSTTTISNNASTTRRIPAIFAIGGIDETNCHIPFVLPQQQYQQESATTNTQNDSNNNDNDDNSNSCKPISSADSTGNTMSSTINIDGIATISAILHSSDPEGTVKRIYNAMKQALLQ